MSELRIVHVETGRHLYGGALQVVYLVQGLARRGCTSLVVCSRGSDVVPALRGTAERVYELDLAGDLDVRFVGRLRRLLRESRPDVVHLHSRRGADVLGGLAARWTGVPVVLSRRVDNPEPPAWAPFKYRLFDAVVTISEGIRQVLVSAGVPADKIRCVPSAVDTERFRPGGDRNRFRREYELPADAPVVGMLAQLIRRKGHRVLLEAVPRVLADVPRALFLLFGRGPLEAELRAEVARRGLEQAVRLVGHRDEIERALPCFDVLVHPAEMEGLGIALLQAAACAVPVVATAVGGIPEIVRDGENGVLVPRGDVDGIARGLVRLLADPDEARRRGAAGRRLVEENFSLDAMVEGNLEVYRSVVSSRSARPRP